MKFENFNIKLMLEPWAASQIANKCINLVTLSICNIANTSAENKKTLLEMGEQICMTSQCLNDVTITLTGTTAAEGN